MYGDSLYCPNTEHLKYCLQFECPRMFKCRRSFCIPFHMLCDGVVDCPNSEDETKCAQLSCPGLLKCVADNICLHPNHICDGITHCKLSMDDELFCESKPCPQGCQCTGYSIYCVNTSLDILEHLLPQTYVIIFKQVKLIHKHLFGCIWFNIVLMIFVIVFTVLYYNILKSQKVHFSLIQHLSLSDLWYITYLILLCYNHMIYGENFKLKHHLWQDSSMCKLLRLFFIVPLLVSQYTSWLISVNTLLLTKYALKMVNISRKQLIISLSIGWVSSCAIAIPYIIVGDNKSSMCIFSSNNTFVIAINICIVSLSTLMMVATTIAHYYVLKHITESSTRIRKSKVTHTKSLEIKFVSISIVNLMTVTTVSLLLNAYLLNEKIISYILVIVLPCKTYANVLIYTVCASGFQIHFWKKK